MIRRICRSPRTVASLIEVELDYSKYFSLSSTVSEEPPLIELVNAKTEDTSFKVEASVRLNRPPPTVSKKQKKTLSEGFLHYELSIKPSAIWGF
jgi:hypothetical protein